MSEIDLKLGRIRDLLSENSLDALLLQRVDNFAWATCGADSHINTAATNGAASLLITPSGRFVISDNIEASRLKKEQGLEAQGWKFQEAPWFEQSRAVAELTSHLKLGSDQPYPLAVDLSSMFPALRAALTMEEGERFRLLGKLCAAAMDSAIRSIRPGLTEHEIAGRLALEAETRGVQAIVNLVATDERVFRYRHPLPTDKHLDRYAMLVLCGRKWGLICSITRLIHFGPLPDELQKKAAAVAQIDAHFIAATRPGRKLKDIFQEGTDSYRAAGYPEEWRLHHQGGLAGYQPREIVATPQVEAEVSQGQVYAWNPSIAGTKSEDTILVGKNQNEILTMIPSWPTMLVNVNSGKLERPAILEVK